MGQYITAILLYGGLLLWIVLAFRAGEVPSLTWLWFKSPKNAAKALRWGVWAAALVFAGVTWIAKPGSELADFRTEATGIAIAVVVIEEISRWRAYLEYKQAIIHQMASQSNAHALDAVRIARLEGWLIDGSLTGADLSYANLQGANLRRACLQKVNFTLANLQEVNLEYALLHGADFNHTNLQNARLGYAKLPNARLDFADLAFSNFQYADLSGTYLNYADLRNADMIFTDLTKATLDRTKVHGTNMYLANLQGANLYWCELQNTKSIVHIYYDNTTIWPPGFTLPHDAVNIDGQPALLWR